MTIRVPEGRRGRIAAADERDEAGAVQRPQGALDDALPLRFGHVR
jgi:hypothetical protein